MIQRSQWSDNSVENKKTTPTRVSVDSHLAIRDNSEFPL